MIQKYNEYLLTEKFLLNDDFLITEKLSFDKIKSIVKNIRNKDAFIKLLLDKYNNAKNKITKKNIIYILIALFMFNFMAKNNKWSNARSIDIEQISNNLSNEESLTQQDVIDYLGYHEKSIILDMDNNISPSQNDINYTNPQLLSLSDKARDFIKKEEGLKLTAYDIGDGKITIGYGHAELKGKSKFKLGDKITIEKANKLFDKDIKHFEKGIKRMFKQWSKKGYDVEITQGMYDALISMAYNMGITGLRNTQFIDYVMIGDFNSAANVLPDTNISDEYPGLKNRRVKEQEFFKLET